MSEEVIKQAVRLALDAMGVEDAEVRLEQPKDPSHGDLATTVALTLAKALRRSPREIAEELASRIDTEGSGIESVSVAGPGFLNFKLSSGQVASRLVEIIEVDRDYGRADDGGEESIVVEFVSANPTGPLHLGHGRQGAIGDAIAGLLDWNRLPVPPRTATPMPPLSDTPAPNRSPASTSGSEGNILASSTQTPSMYRNR